MKKFLLLKTQLGLASLVPPFLCTPDCLSKEDEGAQKEEHCAEE